MWTECVLDAEISRDGVFTFCPIEGDIDGEFVVVTGMNFVGTPPQGMKMVAIVHPDGNDAVQAFCQKYDEQLDTLAADLTKREPELYESVLAEADPRTRKRTI